jgi:hypothetical protein
MILLPQGEKLLLGVESERDLTFLMCKAQICTQYINIYDILW